MTAVRPRPACAGSPLDFHSDDPAEQEACKAICRRCPVAASCLAGAIARDEPCGVWGGQTMGERTEDEMVRGFLRVAVYAPEHGSRAAYVRGCRCHPCTASNAAYVASWRATHTPAPVRPPVDVPQLDLFDEITAVTTSRRVNA